ncbi:hypothetical protein GGR71_003866 [Xanthomonas sp. F1]|uniref:hypothetical protein n=1 Tax=Xanthomonas sp. LMG 8992 TaxID=1591157 RepID=UPI00179C3440|nr:hypothetical protein [Xanthomonas sp. LMG 8992]
MRRSSIAGQGFMVGARGETRVSASEDVAERIGGQCRHRAGGRLRESLLFKVYIDGRLCPSTGEHVVPTGEHNETRVAAAASAVPSARGIFRWRCGAGRDRQIA